LEQKLPTPEVMAKILYGSSSNSARDADVIALQLTNLVVTEENIVNLQSLLRRSIEDPDSFVYNEDDGGLVLQNIPAQLTHNTEESQVYTSLSVAVHKRNLQDYDGDGSLDHHDIFPLPVYLTCKSPCKKACGKAILAQDVVITRAGTVMDLVLLGANLDTDEKARHDQLCDVQRLLKARQGQRPFCAFIWGDLGNRLVAFEELREHATQANGNWMLENSGVELLVDMLKDQSGRRKLLGKDSLVYRGNDLSGLPFRTPECNRLMCSLFKTHVDAVETQNLAVPLPSYKCSPLDRMATELLGFEATCPHVVHLDAMLNKTESDPFLKAARGSRAAYFGWQTKGKGGTAQEAALQRTIKAELVGDGSNTKHLYLQLGWLDGVGVYKTESTKASIKWWETEERVLAFDHLPIRSVVEVECGQGPPLRVWLCAVKLDNRQPTRETLEKLLYGSKDASAEDADVIALSFTDLLVTRSNVDSLRQMLRKVMRRSDDYVYNEDDDGLVLRNIPAQLVRTAARDTGHRFVSLSVAVHKRNVGDYDGDGNLDLHDSFPVPVYLTCKSPRKNEVTACGKAILAQDVIITRPGTRTVLDLVLLSANLDTDDGAKLGQLKELKRLLRARQGDRPFCALIWGDLNNRLVAFEELREHATKKNGKWVLEESGVDLLVKMIDEPVGRLNLLRKDSLLYLGKDLAGLQFSTPACNVLLQELFTLHVDAVQIKGLPVPLPSYKRSPPDLLVTSSLGYSVRFRDVVCPGDGETFQPELNGLVVRSRIEDCKWAYFGWVEHGHSVQRKIVLSSEEDEVGGISRGIRGELSIDADESNMQSKLSRNSGHQNCNPPVSSNHCLLLGWPDGVGIFRGGTASARMVAWETEQQVQAFDHLPIRATISLDVPVVRPWSQTPLSPATLPVKLECPEVPCMSTRRFSEDNVRF
jgi:hypothetical protein